MKKGILSLGLYLGLIVLFFSSHPVEAQTIQYENQVIEQIDVELGGGESTANFDTQAILSRIKTRQGDLFSHTDFDTDLKTLARNLTTSFLDWNPSGVKCILLSRYGQNRRYER